MLCTNEDNIASSIFVVTFARGQWECWRDATDGRKGRISVSSDQLRPPAGSDRDELKEAGLLARHVPLPRTVHGCLQLQLLREIMRSCAVVSAWGSAVSLVLSVYPYRNLLARRVRRGLLLDCSSPGSRRLSLCLLSLDSLYVSPLSRCLSTVALLSLAVSLFLYGPTVSLLSLPLYCIPTVSLSFCVSVSMCPYWSLIHAFDLTNLGFA